MSNEAIKSGRHLAIMLLALSALFAVGTAPARTPDAVVLRSQLEQGVEAGALLSGVAVIRRSGDMSTVSAGRMALDSDRRPGEDSRYQIGSITKPFTYLLLAEMVEAGQLSYETTLSELLGDDFEFANAAVGDITLLELATHTSGLPRLPANLGAASMVNPYADYDEAALLEALRSARQGQPLGHGYAYSNFGAGLLGYLLGRADGRGYQQALTERVLEPLALAETSFEGGEAVATGFSGGEATTPWTFQSLAGAGALWSTSSDLMRLGAIQLGEIPNPLNHDLGADRDIVIDEAGPFRLTRVWHVAESSEGRVFWHNGGTSGFRSFFGFRPATEESLALLLAGDLNPLSIASDWFGFDRIEREPLEVDPEVTGQYRLTPQVGIGVYEQDGQLVTQLSGQSPAPLEPAGDDWYALNVADASLHFSRENGTVVAVELVQNGRTQRAEKVADQADVLSQQAISLPTEALADFVGEYALSPQARFTIRRGDQGLEARLTGQPFFPIFPKGGGVFFYKVVDAELHFERDDEGQVEALVLHQGGIEQRAERVD